MPRCVVCKEEILKGRLCRECSKKVNMRSQEILERGHHRLVVVKKGWGDYAI